MRKSAKPHVHPSFENHPIDDLRIPSNLSLYEALQQRNLLVTPSFPTGLGIHLVQDGEIGLSMNNGKPRFLAAGGRYTLWSPFNEYIETVPITQKKIKLGPIEIVTLDQGEIGWTVKNGENIILDQPGRYILNAPHQFIKTVNANERYIELGTHRRITVPQGYVAIGYNDGKQFIIYPEDTKNGPYITDSPTFSFDPKNGFQSTKMREVKLETLTVNTKENISANVEGVIRYHIADPEKAFFNVEDVHSAIKLQAEATLTSVFAQLSIDQIANSLSSTSISSFKNKIGKLELSDDEVASDDFIHKATDLFIDEFKKIVEQWGVALDNLNIFSMQFTDEVFRETLRTRAQKRMEAATNLVNLESINEVALKNAERESKQIEIEALAKANATKISADAELYSAQKRAEAAVELTKVPLAADLAILRAQADIAREMGKNTVFMPHNLRLGAYGYKGATGQTFWVTNNQQANETALLSEEQETKRATI